MKLFTIPGACSTADHIALQWTGQTFEVEVLTPEKLKSPDYLALNPAGTVPALKDDDFLLTQNVAILGYVGDSYPEARLFGDGSARQRAETTRWLMLCNADMQPVFGTFFAPMTYIADPSQHASLHASSHLKLRRLFERADMQLERRDWLAGFRSVADAYLFIMLRWAAAFQVDLEGLANLAVFRRRMQHDAGVQAALGAEGLA
ncbi:MAG TPA: glutathione S-transferase N-terminal domain-containing protein [Pseudoxanthomonas sp.]